MILAGDIGGTNCRLAIFQDDAETIVREQVFKGADYARFDDVAREFLREDLGTIERACFGVAGAVRDGAVKMTNLGWMLDERALERELRVERMALLNDMVAHAENLERLRGDQLETIREGEPASDGGGALIFPGTGLGEGGLYFDRATRRRHGFSSEGGHCDFAPRNEREEALLRFVRAKGKPSSFEAIVSGPGLRLIYEFLINTSTRGRDFGPAGPKAEEITRAAVDGSCPLCQEAAEIFVSAFGSEAGNLALKCCATAGVWLGGSIARTLVELIRAPLFLDAFETKGASRIRELLAKMPIRLVKFEMNGLYGAANFTRNI